MTCSMMAGVIVQWHILRIHAIDSDMLITFKFPRFHRDFYGDLVTTQVCPRSKAVYHASVD